MKSINFLILIFLMISFSCEKKEIKANSASLVGTWRSKKISINNIDGSELNELISTSTILQINDNKTYYRNYVHGTCSLSKNKLMLHPYDSEIETWEYKIVELTDTELTVNISKTEGKYFGDFDQFESNEILDITETYSRVE